MFNDKSILGCVITELKDQQDRVFRKLHETTIDKNLRLGSKFPRAALRSRKMEYE